jgi:hypothetical protein
MQDAAPALERPPQRGGRAGDPADWHGLSIAAADSGGSTQRPAAAHQISRTSGASGLHEAFIPNTASRQKPVDDQIRLGRCVLSTNTQSPTPQHFEVVFPPRRINSTTAVREQWLVAGVADSPLQDHTGNNVALVSPNG